MTYSQFYTRIEAAAKWAKITGVSMLAIGVIVIIVGLAASAQTVGSSPLPVFVAATLFYFFPGGVLLLVTRWLTAARVWAYYLMMGMCGLSMAGMLYNLARGMDDPYFGLTVVVSLLVLAPWILLFVACLNALPDARDMRKASLRDGPKPQGFSVVPPANPMPTIKPPPPATTIIRKHS